MLYPLLTTYDAVPVTRNARRRRNFAKFEIRAKISIADRECEPMEQHRLPLALATDIVCSWGITSNVQVSKDTMVVVGGARARTRTGRGHLAKLIKGI